MIADLALNTRRNYRERVCPQYSACDWWYVTPMSNLCTAKWSSTGWKLTMLVQQFAKLILRWGQCLNQLLETGLRTGEVIGLSWDAINWEKRTLTVNKTLEYRHKQGFWRAGPPKTQQSYRTIPLTNCAYEILQSVELSRAYRKESPMLSQTLEYMDRRTGVKERLVMRDLVFINFRTGMPNKNSSYDTHPYKLCDEAGIKRFCMHALRHTYATRAIESGMQPKGFAKAAWPRKYQDDDGSLCPCDGRFYGKCSEAI